MRPSAAIASRSCTRASCSSADTPANLKAKLGKGRFVRDLGRAAQPAHALEHAEGISSLVLTGDGVHVVVDDAARRIPEFKARLASAHVPFDAIQQVTPTIEDLFVDAVAGGASRHG